jgi:hypothetical protein
MTLGPTLSPKPNVALPLIIYVAFLSACLIYAVVLFVLEKEGLLAEEWPFPVSPVLVSGLLTILDIALGIWLGNRKKPDPNSGGESYLMSLQQRVIIQSACYEAIAVFGLVAAMLGAGSTVGYVAIGIGFLVLLTLLPGIRSGLDRYYQLVKDGAGPERRLGGG